MKKSLKVSLFGWGVWISSYIIAAASVPTSNSDDFDKSMQVYGFFVSISNLGLLVGLIALIVFAYNSIMDKSIQTTIIKGPVDNSIINAGPYSTVATTGSKIDQNGKVINQSINIANTSDIDGAFDTISSFFDSAEGITESEIKYGKLLVKNLQDEISSNSSNKTDISNNIDNMKQIIDSTTNAGKSIKSAIELILSVV